MDEIIKVWIKDKRRAPWGIFGSGPKPVPLIWLTEVDPMKEFPSRLLGEANLAQIVEGVMLGYLGVEGLGIDIPLPPEPVYPEIGRPLPIDRTVPVVEEQGDNEETAVFTGIAEITLKKKASLLKKELQEQFSRYPAEYFQICRSLENRGKGRKSIVKLLTDMIQAKISSVTETSRQAEEKLTDFYSMLIEEEEEEVTLPLQEATSLPSV